MGIAKALTNDLERALRLYRIPILTAFALSLRQYPEDRFLLTDDQTEDPRRNVYRLRRISIIEQQATKPGVGCDDRQFTRLTGSLLFTGLSDTSGVVQPLYNLTNTGGRTDLDGVVFTASGTTTQKQEKAQRYNVRRPGDVTWRVRTPVMMADETSVIDYLSFRCTQLKYLHSISFKWSDRRWDARQIGLDQDLFRPDGEKTDMVTLAAMWMDPSMSILNPEVWGPYEDLIRANYEEYLGRKVDEQVADCAAFSFVYSQYIEVLRPSVDAEPPSVNAAQHGRVSRYLDTISNRALHIPFNRDIINQGGNDSYRVTEVDPETALDVTQDVFNLLDADAHWRFTSSFEADNLADDGWCGTAYTSPSTDIPPNLPPYTYLKDKTPVYGTKSVAVADGYICRRIVLPNGSYGLSMWILTFAGDAKIEVVRNNRLRPKGWAMDQDTNRVTSIQHWRENYETVASTNVRGAAGWRHITVSFDLVDQMMVPGEGYPAHEIYIVLTADASTFDHLNLYQDRFGHNVTIQNTINLSTQPFDTRPELRHVNLEKCFQTDSEFGTRERAAHSFRFDGKDTIVQAESRPAYNVRAEGTTIDTWFKINSDDETANNVLGTRGEFTLFQKTGSYLPGYVASVDREKIVRFSLSDASIFNSVQFRNSLLQPSVGTQVFPPRTDWGNSNIYDTYKTAFKETGLQPLEWQSIDGTVTIGVPFDIGGGKYLLVSPDDPYVSGHGSIIASEYLLWHAQQAYAQIMPVDRVNPAGTAGGFVFAPIPINPLLYTIEQFYGVYTPSPAQFSPRWLFSPTASPYPSPGDLHPFPATVFTPASPPISPADEQPFTYPVYWPIAPQDWGDLPIVWPADSFLYGPAPTWTPFTWDTLFDDANMRVRHPLFVGGKIRYDRWCHINVAMAMDDLEVGINSITVIQGSVTINPNAKLNGDDLLIGTSNPRTINTAAPVSFYSFKIFQYRMPALDRISIFAGEAVNFNELQYSVFGENLDYDKDGVMDFWQENTTDLGLWTSWNETRKSPYQPFPIPISEKFGAVRASVEDPITIVPDIDRNRSLIADWFDEAYLQELIDIQTVGFSDGLILWDFMNQGQAVTYDYNDRVWDATCNKYVPRTLSYLDWLRSVLNEEWNSITSVQDPVPNFAAAGSPSPWKDGASPNPVGSSPWPTYGDKDNELVMTGIKGWFGFEGLLGYRDSLEKVAKESIVFNYLQIELHFRAPRTELEAVLKPYAHSIDDIYEDAYVGNHLTKQTES